MPYPEATLRALVALQHAITPDEVWHASNQLLRATLPVFHTLIGLPCVGTKPVFLRTTLPVADPDPEAYFVRLNAATPLGPLLAASPGALVLRLSDTFSAEALRGTPFFEDFMKPEGWSYCAGMMFWSDSGEFIGQLSLIRTEAQGDITDVEIQRLRGLHPLVNAAITRLLVSEKCAAAQHSLEHAVHSLPLAMVAIGWDLSINYINGPARPALANWKHGSRAARALKNDPALQLPADLLTACKELKADWESAMQTNALGQMELTRYINHSKEPDQEATLQLIEPVAGRSLQPSFVIHFASPVHEHPESKRAISKLSSLTPAERDVARLAAAGYKNPELARKLSVSESTVRTHLRSVFRKLEITGRGKLAPIYRSLESF